MKLFPLHLADFYKVGHRAMYPEGTELVYSNFTPRTDKLARMLPDFDHKVVFFGLQGVIKWLLIDLFNDGFFKTPKRAAVEYYRRRMDSSLGAGTIDVDHVEALHDLGYLPLLIKALPEGSRVNIRVPVFTVQNTHPDFFWLTNYVETLLSAECWKSITAATTAFEFRRLLHRYAKATGSPADFVLWQGHDFSMRGMSGVHDAAHTGAAHLLSFRGTDTIPAIDYLEECYDARESFVGGSVPATEHSVMCMGGKDDEVETFRRLMELHPSGVLSIVSDTWDFWNVITNTATVLKSEILSRTPDALGLAKVVFRPDSGDPVKIICGDTDAPRFSPAHKGAVECLWEIFGGTTTETGHRILDSHVGLIYGDSITLERAAAILAGLQAKGFASCNIVFGIGSYTYQGVTRDTFGHAMKATAGVVKGEFRELFKDPVTDNGAKRSAKGLLRVEQVGSDFVLFDQQSWTQEGTGELRAVFNNGQQFNRQSLDEIRNGLEAYLE